MKILICGGRDFTDFEVVCEVMLSYLNQDIEICAGEARGADTLAKKWAQLHGIKYTGFPAKWNEFGKRAGYVRNQQMLDEFKPDLVIAFPGGRGTQMMTEIARKAKVEVIKVGIL